MERNSLRAADEAREILTFRVEVQRSCNTTRRLEILKIVLTGRSSDVVLFSGNVPEISSMRRLGVPISTKPTSFSA